MLLCLSVVFQRQWHASPTIPNPKSHSVAGDESAQVNMRDGDTSGGDISLVTPDITVNDYEKQNQLKASKHAGNDIITNSDAQLAAKASKLEWVSVGYPTLLYISLIAYFTCK